MAGTPINYSILDITRGPVNIFTNVAVPAANAEVVIDSTGNVHTPDATANPSAIHIGLSKDGADLLYKPTTENQMADELTSPYRSSLTDEEIMISPKGNLQIGQNLTLTVKQMLGGTLSAPALKSKITAGGLSALTYFSVLAIWAQPEAPTKYMYWLLYRAFNDSGLAMTISRKSDASSDLAFRGFADSSRAAGDQILQIVRLT